MKRLVFVIFLLQLLTSYGQPADIKSMVDSLSFLKQGELDCSQDLYWKIVAAGDKAIPLLIDKLNDTTPTEVHISCKNTCLNVGEVAYFALQEIAFFPAFVITHIQFDVFYNNGCWSFYDYLFDNKNKGHYQSLVRQWYFANKPKFELVTIPEKDLTPCQKQFHISHYLYWKE